MHVFANPAPPSKEIFLNNPTASQNENSGCIYFQKNYCLVFNIHQDGFKIRKGESFKCRNFYTDRCLIYETECLNVSEISE